MPVSSFNYNDILLRCARNDANALTALYHHEAAVMLSLAQQMLDDHSKAQQALHDVFVMVWKHASHFDVAAGSARAWIYSIFRYRLMRELRQMPAPLDAERIGKYRSWLDENQRLLHDDLNDGLADADPQAADAMGLAYYKGLDEQQIARVLEQTEPEVKDNLQRALGLMERSAKT